MLFRTINKSSILSAVWNVNLRTRFLHTSYNNYIRRVPSKYSSSDSTSDYLEKSFDSLGIEQNCNRNFLGIESDEGVIIIDAHNSSQDTQSLKQKHALREKSKEKFYKASFGVIRQDSDNKLSVHGQYENNDSVFPYKSTEYSDVSGQHHEMKTDIFSVLYNNSNDHKLKLHSNEVSSSEEILPVNPHFTMGTVNEGTQQCSDRKEYSTEHPDMSYIDECFFNNVAEKDNSNKIGVMNENSNEELSYLDEKVFGKQANLKNYISSNEVSSIQNIVENNKVLSSDATSKDPSFDNKDEDSAAVDDTKYLARNESSSDDLKHALKSHSLFVDNNAQTELNDPENSYIKQKILAKSKHLSMNDFQKVNTVHVKDFVPPDYLSNRHSSQIDFKDIQKDDVLFHNKNKKQVVKMQSNALPPEANSGRESDAGAILPKTEKPFAFEKISSSKSAISDLSADTDHINTAHEFVTKLRKENEVENQAVKKGVRATTGEKLDSKGFRILKNQVPDLSQFTRDEIMTILKDNILYLDDNLLILNKPYSLVIHDSKTTQYPCLSLFLEDLAKDLDRKTTDPKLFTVHRLDKETTGCLLLARNECMAQKLKSLFAQRKIIKKYWILTSRAPDPLQGVIDIPISEGSVSGKKRMVLNPHIPKDIPYQNHSKSGRRAVTSYKTLSLSGNAALVEVTPETGIKHQIRVHFGFGLSCPIVGDHKYSHLDKMAPQKLPSDLLQRLQVRQSKVRHIPMHIHAHSVTIPEYLDGRNLYTSAPLPAHMTANLKKLKFKKKNKLVL